MLFSVGETRFLFSGNPKEVEDVEDTDELRDPAAVKPFTVVMLHILIVLISATGLGACVTRQFHRWRLRWQLAALVAALAMVLSQTSAGGRYLTEWEAQSWSISFFAYVSSFVDRWGMSLVVFGAVLYAVVWMQYAKHRSGSVQAYHAAALEKERTSLRPLERLVLTALSLDGESSVLVIHDKVIKLGGERVNLGAVYVALERLEDRDFVYSWEDDPAPERGGTTRKYFRLGILGERALQQSTGLKSTSYSSVSSNE
ncbi:MAG TPA: hypothetical protein VE422_14615 [Terriglobia bacterium]|nr:hypothetical protein [Terriglobia bacterium]